MFVAAFLFLERILGLIIGPRRAEARQFKRRLQFVAQSQQSGAATVLLRDAGLDSNSVLSSWPGMTTLNRRLSGSGRKLTAPQAVATSLALGAAGFVVCVYLVGLLPAAIFGVLLAAIVPVKISMDYKARMQRFEEGLVEALDVMTRALRAGQPFNESMLMVAQELQGPVAEEFGLTFAELNYGLSPKQAFENMLERVPSLTLKALVVAVLLQRETGGNLAELLDKISRVLRGRFRFHRKVRTLSAEGRMSSAVLIAVPFVLFAILYISSPEYATVLLNHPTGHTMITFSSILLVVGIVWVRRLTRIDV